LIIGIQVLGFLLKTSNLTIQTVVVDVDGDVVVVEEDEEEQDHQIILTPKTPNLPGNSLG